MSIVPRYHIYFKITLSVGKYIHIQAFTSKWKKEYLPI